MHGTPGSGHCTQSSTLIINCRCEQAPAEEAYNWYVERIRDRTIAPKQGDSFTIDIQVEP
eukprot:scaffold679_cov374-Prasinococcus_capsulatus_cf.AAC.9